MKSAVSLFLGALLLSGSLPAWASQQTGRVTHLWVRAMDGLIYLVVDGTRIGRPACASHPHRLVANENGTAGKQQYAALHSANLMGRAITVFGSGRCVRWPDGEYIATVLIQD